MNGGYGVHGVGTAQGWRVLAGLVVALELVFLVLWMAGESLFGYGLVMLLPIAVPSAVLCLAAPTLRPVFALIARRGRFAAGEIEVGITASWPPVPIALADRDREGHVAILGRMGSGKSSQMRLMIEQDIAQHRPVILVDPHTSLAGECTSLCLQHGRLPILIAPDPEWMNTLNFLETGPGYDPIDAARTVMEGIVQVYLPYQSEIPMRIRHLTEPAAYMLAAAHGGYTMLELNRWLLQPNFRDYLARKLAEVPDNRLWLESSQALSSLRWINSLNRTQLHDQFQSTWTRVAGLLSHPDVRRIVGSSCSSFDFQEIRNGEPLLVAIGEESLHRTATLLNALTITWITKRLLGITADQGSPLPLALYVDELAEISPESFERLLRQARKHSVYLTTIFQAQTMLHKNLYEDVMANIPNLLIFASGGPGVEELAREICRPDEAERRAGSVGSFVEFQRQFHRMASTIRDLPKYHFLLWQAGRQGCPLHCRSRSVSWSQPAAVRLAKGYALRRKGKPVALIDQEIRERTAELDARFGPLHDFGDPISPAKMAPW